MAIVIWAILAVNRWTIFYQRGNDENRFIAILWTIMAVGYTVNLIMALRDKKFAQKSQLNNSEESSE